MVEKGARQSETRHQTLALIMRVPGVIARSSKSWGFRVKKTLRISWMVCHCIHYHMESSNPRNLRIPLASSLGCASSGSERAFYGQGCYFAELAQHLRVEIIPFEENATTWNQGRRFGLSVNCMSWVWETVWDSTVGLGKVFAFVIAMRPTETISCYWQMCCVVMCLGEIKYVHVHISFSEFTIFCRQAIWQSLSGVWDGRRATRPVKQYEAVWSGEVCPVWARYATVSRHSNLAIELPNHTQEHWKAGSNWSPVQSCLVAQQ